MARPALLSPARRIAARTLRDCTPPLFTPFQADLDAATLGIGQQLSQAESAHAVATEQQPIWQAKANAAQSQLRALDLLRVSRVQPAFGGQYKCVLREFTHCAQQAEVYAAQIESSSADIRRLRGALREAATTATRDSGAPVRFNLSCVGNDFAGRPLGQLARTAACCWLLARHAPPAPRARGSGRWACCSSCAQCSSRPSRCARHIVHPAIPGAARQHPPPHRVQTPNPESLKFLPGKPVLGVPSSRDFRSFKDAQVSPLAKKLFATEGVAGVFLANDFLTVSKAEGSDWLELKPQIFATIMDFYASGEAVMSDPDAEGEVDSLEILDSDSEVVQMVKELLDMRIRPSVQEDGGDIKFIGFNEESGVVTLEMQGSCSGCPSSAVTLKSGIENMLTHYIPEVKEVVNLEEGGAEAIERSLSPEELRLSPKYSE